MIELILILLITILTTLTLTKKEDKNKNTFSNITISGWFVLAFSIGIIILKSYTLIQSNISKGDFKSDEIDAQIKISANSKEAIDQIYLKLPDVINAKDIKIGTDNLQMNFEKERPYSGKGRAVERWYMCYTLKSSVLEKYRLDSNNAEQLNGKTFKIKIPEIDEIICDSKSVIARFSLELRNIDTFGKIKCSDGFSVKLKDIE